MNYFGIRRDVPTVARHPADGLMNDFAQQFEQHYAELGPALRGYFRRQPALTAVADDLLQETFLRAWRERARLRTVVSPRAYLFGIARHVGIDALRRRRATEPLVDEFIGDEPEAKDERVGMMRVAIAQLPETHRETLRLKLQHDLSYAEIAVVLDVPVGTVRSRLHYAIERLQRALNPEATAAARPFYP